ncbi:MAG TPA: hypothetical protein VFJ82_08800 [Longimicrobium sp.]|nr:hypothetical protein [Longimicrobium sp.]
MAAERDEAGPSGPGLSGTGRDTAGIEAGTTRSASFGDAPGNADVHAGIAFNPQATDDQGVRERVTNRVKDAAGTVGETAAGLGQRARSLAGDVAGRAGDLASQARERVEALGDRATETLEERGWLGRLRENPLPALGVAFAAGFLLSGGGRGGKGQRVRGELRSAVAAGLSAGLAQGARAFLRNAGAEDGVINSLLENLPVLGGQASGRSSAGSQGGYGGPGRGGPSAGGRTGGMAGTGRPGAMPGRTGGPQGSGRTGGSPYGGPTGTTHRAPSHRENY